MTIEEIIHAVEAANTRQSIDFCIFNIEREYHTKLTVKSKQEFTRESGGIVSAVYVIEADDGLVGIFGTYYTSGRCDPLDCPKCIAQKYLATHGVVYIPA